MLAAAAATAAYVLAVSPRVERAASPPAAAWPPAPAWAASRLVDPGWAEKHARIRAKAAAVDADAARPFDLALFGDSITQFYVNNSAASFPGKHVFVSAIGGDAVQQLMWRLANGGMPRRAPLEARVLIGTNNLNPRSSVHLPPLELAERVADVLRYLRAAWPSTRLVLLLLLPRTKYESERQATNAELRKLAIAGLVVSDCGKELVPAGPDIPDGTHPSAAGHAKIDGCLGK